MAEEVKQARRVLRVRRIRAKSVGEEEESGLSAFILAGVLIVVAWYLLAHGLQTLIDLEVHHWASANPELNSSPQALPQPGGAAPMTTRIEHFNYEFYVPWKKVSENESKDSPSAEIRSDDGHVVVFYNPDAQLDVLKDLQSETNPLGRNYDQIFHSQPVVSNFDLYKSVYSANPAQMRLLMPRLEALRLNALLLWKLAFGIDERGPTYTFDWGGLRGIQFGDPASSQPVAIRAFDNHDRLFRYIFIVAAGSNAKFTQDDISQIVLTSRTAY